MGQQAEIERRVARLYAEYARAVDDGDLVTLRAMVADDVAITRGGETFPGVEEFMAVYQGVVDAGVPCQHAVTGLLVDATSGGGLRVRAYFRALFFDAPGTRLVVGRYDDDLVEVDGHLRFAHKRNLVERVVALPASSN
jgi:hypothetical protein